MRRTHYAIAAVTVACALALAPRAARAETAPRERGSVRVRILDAETGRPVAGAKAVLRGRERTTGAGGEVAFDDVARGEATLRVERGGYLPAERRVKPGDAAIEVDLEIRLEPSPAKLDGIVVNVIGRDRSLRDIYHPTASLSGDDLQRNLASSVPATLEAVPGVAVQYNGPGAANPSIRGMPGDRVLMLEDGHRTGDIYWSGADHGVAVEPISARRIEVIRGPASLLYGSNALGGVINVVRDDVPTSRPDRIEGAFTSQYESVNHGVSSGAVVRGPAGPLAYYGEATGRRAGDTRTPEGTLEQTDLRAYNLAAGLSWLPNWGVVGAAARYYDNLYGVPGEFDGELIPGGHPGGVDIDASRASGRMRAAYHDGVGAFETVELRSSATRYLHDELEGVVGDETIIGAQFDQITTDTHLVAHRDPAPPEARDGGLGLGGALGLSAQTRDLAAGGASPGTRSGRERAAGGFAFGELGLEPLRVVAGLRYDLRHVRPDRLDPLRVRTQERQIEKDVAPRTFGAVSGSLATLWDVAEGWTLGASLARSFRNPTLEELYSDGPHLADFSFNIGSPDLDSEVGLGADVFLRVSRPGLSMELAGYYNRVNGYIYYGPTGETVRVYREGVPPRVTPVFEARGDDAVFAGAEGRIQWDVIEGVVLDATASFTRAERVAEGDPLPFIPPLSGRLEARYERGSFFGSVGGELGAPQNRVPRPVQVGESLAEPQQPTAGYALLDAGLGWRHEGRYADHTLMLQVENATDRAWRDHMSRIKDVAPQPGRSVRLSYRGYF